MFEKRILKGRYAWIWDPESGKRFRIEPESDGSYRLAIGPAGSLLMVFDENKDGEAWQPLPWQGPGMTTISGPWEVEFRHFREETVKHDALQELTDLKDIPEYEGFCGTVIYRYSIRLEDPVPTYINLGQVYGVARLLVNGTDCGLRWYGNRIFDLSRHLNPGMNTIEIQVITEMGNYMRTLDDNPVARYWMHRKGTEQPLMPMGLTGPVTLYSKPD